MKYLITGAQGVIGTELIQQLKNNYSEVEYCAIGRKELDVENKQMVKEVILENNPDVVIHLAAWTNVDSCEEKQKECYRTNVTGTANICQAVKEIGAILVYPSTFYVYSGEEGKVFDERVDQPILEEIVGYYSKTKLLGEQEISKHGLKKYYIIMIGALFGGGINDKKFVAKILKKAKKNETIEAVNDRVVQPTYANDLVSNLLKLISTNKYGIYNMVGKGKATYYQYAQAILSFAGLQKVELLPISSSQFVEAAPRAKNLSAINGNLQEIGLDLMRDWQEALKDYIENELLKGKIYE